MGSMPNVQVILGSVRAGRLCPKVADWVVELGRRSTTLNYELIDLADWPLPMDDEPGIPAQGIYAQAHTRAWSEKIAGGDGFIFVTPQYNWGYPAGLKNAIDHLYKEWHGKPVTIISYGGHGGSKSSSQLQQVITGLKMRPTETMPQIVLTREMINGAPVEPAAHFRPHEDSVRQALAELVALV